STFCALNRRRSSLISATVRPSVCKSTAARTCFSFSASSSITAALAGVGICVCLLSRADVRGIRRTTPPPGPQRRPPLPASRCPLACPERDSHGTGTRRRAQQKWPSGRRPEDPEPVTPPRERTQRKVYGDVLRLGRPRRLNVPPRSSH